MTMADLSNIAQALAAVATVLSLLFVGVQIRQNTRATRAAAHHNAANSLIEINRMLAENGDLAAIYVAGASDRKSLAPEEQLRFDAALRAYLHVCQTMFVQTELGTGDDSIHMAEEGAIRTIFTFPGVRESWAESPSFGFSPAFRSYVAGMVPVSEPGE